MKVLHLVKTSVGATWALRQMRELVGLGVEVHVALPAGGGLVKEYEAAGVRVHALTYSAAHLFDSCRQLKKVVAEVDPDLIHSHFVLTTLLMRLALRSDRRPRIFQVPGPLHLENRFFRMLDIRTARKNDYWVGSCTWTNERYAASGISRDRLFLSYYGSDIRQRKSAATGKLRRELHLGDDAVLVGLVAYMYPPKRYLGQRRGLKGHEDFIDAVARVARRYPQVYGVCIGGPWGNAAAYERRVKAYAARRTDRVYFLGTRSDVPELYADLFCAVHPSLSENLGGAAESLALGVPTVATRVGGFPDIVIHGETGLLVPPSHPQALAEALTDLLEGRYDREKMAQRGVERVAEMLDVRNTARSVFEIYGRLIPGCSAGE